MLTHRLAAGVFWLLLQPASLSAQTLPRGAGWGATMVIEPVIIAHGGFSALCNPRAAAEAGWVVDQIEKVVSPTGPQQAALANLKAAVTKAADTSTGVCPAQIPRNSHERLAFLEKRLAAAPTITVPTITMEGDANGAPHPEPEAYAKKFAGKNG